MPSNVIERSLVVEKAGGIAVGPTTYEHGLPLDNLKFYPFPHTSMIG